ncbi:FecR family protein [Mariniflexile sp. HMF6888]|uniref:FecR family protein n=1 Tax=Mariniflexile sp. HMF6888 TaxID=3373086 RepID=UPI0037B6608E
MMSDNNLKIINLISAYISKDISKKEFDELSEWLNKDPNNRKLFSDYLLIYKKARRLKFIKKFDKDATWNSIVSKLNMPLEQELHSKKSIQKSTPYSIVPILYKYAAVAVLFLGVAYLYSNGLLVQNNTTTIPEDSITLQLENGKIEILNEDGSKQIVDKWGHVIGMQNGQQLVYNYNPNEEELVYNTLTIPYGKRYEIKMSDGTVAHLNSGTSLRYPTNFIKGKNREVFVNGEVNFDVAKDPDHPFIVKAGNLNIKVYGTVFNVSAYSEDKEADVVLVEGSVSMYTNVANEQERIMLVPGIKGSLDKENLTISTEKVDTQIYTSWMHGEMFFRNMSFENIAKKLERYYNKKIMITDEALKNEIFNAHFKEEPIENVLGYFKESFLLEYRIEGDNIYIN